MTAHNTENPLNCPATAADTMCRPSAGREMPGVRGVGGGVAEIGGDSSSAGLARQRPALAAAHGCGHVDSVFLPLMNCVEHVRMGLEYARADRF